MFGSRIIQNGQLRTWALNQRKILTPYQNDVIIGIVTVDEIHKIKSGCLFVGKQEVTKINPYANTLFMSSDVTETHKGCC